MQSISNRTVAVDSLASLPDRIGWQCEHFPNKITGRRILWHHKWISPCWMCLTEIWIHSVLSPLWWPYVATVFKSFMHVNLWEKLFFRLFLDKSFLHQHNKTHKSIMSNEMAQPIRIILILFYDAILLIWVLCSCQSLSQFLTSQASQAERAERNIFL